MGQRIVWEAIVAAAGDSRDGMRVAQELTGLAFEYTHAISAAIPEGAAELTRADECAGG